MSTTLRKQREVRERELQLLNVARGMLIEHGYAGLSMDRLAEATAYSKGTVYQHFQTKEDLVTALASQTMEQRTGLFERVTHFRGRPRERMHGIGMADELFSRLYPHSFRSELIIKMANLEARASDDRRAALQVEEDRCLQMPRSVIEEAVAVGDLPASTSVDQVMFAIMTLAIGTHTAVSSFRAILRQIQVANPFESLRDNIHTLLDGFGWKPLSAEWDYAQTTRRLIMEVFADEFRRLDHEPG